MLKNMCFLKSFFKTFAVVAFFAGCVFAQEPVSSDSAKTAELLEEIAIRDSVMALHDSSCAAEKDSLRFAMKLESSMCESWKQSYETMKTDYATCTQSLNAATEANERQKEDSRDHQKSAATMAASAFVGGVGIGMLLFWLLF